MPSAGQLVQLLHRMGCLGHPCHLQDTLHIIMLPIQLKDKFCNTRLGRKLVVFAASRQASRACRCCAAATCAHACSAPVKHAYQACHVPP